MRRRISWLVAAATSAVVLAFVIPLCLLARTLAEDRARADGDDEARAVAILVAREAGDPTLPDAVVQADLRSPALTTVVLPSGRRLGSAQPGLAADDPELARAAAGTAFSAEQEDGLRIYVPVVTRRGTWVVVTTVSSDLMHAGVARAWTSIILLGVAMLGLAVFVADRLGRRISEPVTDLAAVAQRLQEGDLDARAHPAGPPETVELAETVNRLADRIVELLAAERAAVGDLSHRLRTPVTALRLDAEAVPEEELSRRLQEHIEHLQRTIDALVRDARRPLRSGLTASCDAAAVVGDRMSFWKPLAEDQRRPLVVDVPSATVPVGLERADLTDLLDVLVDNVFAHTPDGTPFQVSLRRDPSWVVLEVRDEGPGPAPSTAPAPNEDSADGARVGTSGLGLQIVRRTAARVGGALTLEAADPGLRARVTLPALATDGARPPVGGRRT